MTKSRRPSKAASVFKFGGTSVGSLEALRLARQHVQAHKGPLAIVVSAMNGVTDLLLQGAEAAARGDRDRAEALAAEFEARHMTIAEQLLTTRVRQEDMHALI